MVTINGISQVVSGADTLDKNRNPNTAANAQLRAKAGRVRPTSPNSYLTPISQKLEPQGGKEQTVVIAAYTPDGHRTQNGQLHHEDQTFGRRSDALPADQHFNKVYTGKDFVQALVDASKKGPIKTLAVLSHSGPHALFMKNDEGVYASTLEEIRNKIRSGEIRFTDHAKIILTGCKSAEFEDSPPIAALFSDVVPGSTVYGAAGKTEPRIETKRGQKYDGTVYRSEGGRWMRFVKGNGETVAGDPAYKADDKAKITPFYEFDVLKYIAE